MAKQETLDKIPKDTEIVTICPHGNRATIGKYIMQRYGYNVKVLEGGLDGPQVTEVEQANKEFEIDGSKVKLVQVRRIGKGCMSYAIESGEEIAVIDPVFPTDNYIQTAGKSGAKITKVIDTHQHADHVSAAKDLAQKANATLHRSAYEQYQDNDNDENNQHQSSFTIEKLQDGDTFNIGSISLKVIHTPGHTPGSLTINVGDKLLFTGDTLFVDSIGRPNLRDKAAEFAENFVQYDTKKNYEIT